MGFRLLLLRINSGSCSVYNRAAAPQHPGTSQRTTAASNQSRSIPAVRGGRHTESRVSELGGVSAENRRMDPRRHESSCSANSYVCLQQRSSTTTNVSLSLQICSTRNQTGLTTHPQNYNFIYLHRKLTSDSCKEPKQPINEKLCRSFSFTVPVAMVTVRFFPLELSFCLHHRVTNVFHRRSLSK